MFHAVVQLEEGRQEDAERECYIEQLAAQVASAEVDEVGIGQSGHEPAHHVGDGVVHPVEHDAGHDAPRAPIHPAQQQTDERGMEKLRQVAMTGSEEQSRDQNGKEG